jgi:hypothetical protein
VLLAHLRELVVDAGDQLVDLVRLAQRLAGHPRHVLPRRAVVREVLGLADGRRDLRQLAVLLLGHPRVEREDQVRLEVQHLLLVEVVALADDLRSLLAPQVLRPRPQAVRALLEPVDRADRLDAEREHRVLVGQPERDDPLRLLRDLGRAVLVLDRHRERRGPGLLGTGVLLLRRLLGNAATGERQCCE